MKSFFEFLQYQPKKRILIFIIILLSQLNIFSQESAEVEGKIINKIIIKGLQKSKKKDVLPLIFSLEGTELDLALIDEDYQRLMGLGYYEEIIISTEDAYDEQTNEPLIGMTNLVYEFIEKPTIRKTIFRGNKNLSYGALMGDITIKRGDFLDVSRVHSDISAIIEKYNSKGFKYVKVDYEVFQNDELKETNRVDLIFTIEEGIETYVSDIIINGNNNISDFTIKTKLKTKERKFLGLQKGTFDESVFNQDIEEIKKYYKDLGYYLVEIMEPEITYYDVIEKGQKKELIKIKIFINENDQYTFGGITLNGNKIFTDEELLYNFRLEKGQIFNYSKYQEALFTIQRRYNDSGYIQTVVNDNQIIDKENKTISAEVNIQESKRSYIEAIYFKGNEKTRNYVLRRAISTEPGEIFNSSKLMSSIIGLYNLGYFANVEYDIQPGSAPGLLKITYILEEQQTAEVRFGVTIPATQWPPEVTLFAEINEKDFLGRELYMSGKVEGSLYKQGFTYSFDDPWFLNFPWSLGGSVKFYHNWIQYVLRDIDNDLDGKTELEKRQEYDENAPNEYGNKNYIGYDNDFFNRGIHNIDFEIAARTGYRFLKYFSVGGGISTEPIFSWIPESNYTKGEDDQQIDPDTTYYDAIEKKWRVRNRVYSTFSINTTKRKINPYEGLKYSLTSGYTFGHYDSFSISTNFTYYWKILDVNINDWPFKNVVVFNTSLAFIFPGFRNLGGTMDGVSTYDKGPILYPTEYLTIDGLFSGRGWANSLAGRSYLGALRGYVKFDFSLEYRVPIYDKIIWAAAFIDTVNIFAGPYPLDSQRTWRWWQDKPGYQPMGIDNWYFSTGVGLELTFPQLPLSFFIVKRFKVNYYTGFEWMHNNVGDIDFVLSMVGVSF